MADLQPEPLLLIPGLLCSPALFAAQIHEFSGQSRKVVVADHTRADRVETIARQILAEAPPRFALAGLSMGGYIVFEIMRAAPERVTRVALLDTSAQPDLPERTADRHRLIEVARTDGVRQVQRLLLPRLIHPARLGDAALVETVLGMADATGLDAFVRQQHAIIARPDSRPDLPRIACPALVLVGSDDLQTPIAAAQEIAAGIPGSRLAVIPGCGHLSTLERPDAVNRELGAWLQL